jgi:hypothetical protein
MNKEQQKIIEAVGQEYTKWFYANAVPSVSGKPILNGEGILTRGEFINKCKTDIEFSEKWELKIEERVLSTQERADIYYKSNYAKDTFPTNDNGWNNLFDGFKIPTKLISITYKETKIEIYE